MDSPKLDLDMNSRHGGDCGNIERRLERGLPGQRGPARGPCQAPVATRWRQASQKSPKAMRNYL
jgi:hypothetical protein